MRDPFVRRVAAGLILALPLLIYLASATSSAASASGIEARPAALSLGLSEVVLVIGIGLAAIARRRFMTSEPMALDYPAFGTSLNADPIPG